MISRKGVVARASVSREKSSLAAGAALVQDIRRVFGAERPAALLVYATVDHDLDALLTTLREGVGAAVIVGASTSGLTGRGFFHEGNYAAGVAALGGPALRAAGGVAEDYARDTLAKGQALGRALRADLGDAPPRAVIVYGDPLCGADFESFARAVQDELGCPVVGGGAGQPWGVFAETYQLFDVRARSRSAVALALGGDFAAELATSTGSDPTASSARVTRAEGNVLLELDGRPALAVYSEFLGLPTLTSLSNDINTRVALGVELSGDRGDSEALSPFVVRGPFALDTARGGLVLGASIPEGTRVVFHTRSIRAAVDGAERAAHALARRLAGRQVRAVLGFECGARTIPLLGKAEATREQALVQGAFAPDVEWLGALMWGEVAPFGGRATYYNFTYPLLAIAESA